MAKEVVVKAEKITKRKKKISFTKMFITITLFLLIGAFIILSIVYNGGNFTVSLDKRLALDNHLILYEDPVIKEGKRKLSASKLEFMDNISIDWIPKNIENEKYGSHNGKNYIAYTFYLENAGEKTVDYWYSVLIDDVIKNVDEAVRVMVYFNNEKTVYAKINSFSNVEEKGTKAFYDEEKAVLEQRKNFAPGETDKFTIVVWLEGDDPDCKDNLLGGEIKMHMDIRQSFEEKVLNEKEKKEE